MSHLEEGLLHALLDGEIPSAELPPIQAHLTSCATCRARLEEERLLLIDATGMVAVLEVPQGESGTVRHFAPASHRRAWGRGLAWAASLIGAIGLGYVLRGSGPPAANQATIAQVPAPAPAETPAPAPAPAPALDAAKASPPVLAERGLSRQRPPESTPRMAPEGMRAGATVRSAGNLEPSKPRESAPEERKASLDLAATASRDSLRNLPRSEPPAAAAAAPANAAQRLAGVGSQPLRLEEAIVAGAAQGSAAKAQDTPAEPISLTDALRRLRGSIRLLDGWIPLRLEAQGPYVRVIYPVAQGELVLSQQLIDGRVVFTLIAPPGFPRDSLARLRGRVRE